MTPVSGKIALALLIVTALASPAAAQRQRAQTRERAEGSRPAPARVAVPRTDTSAPRQVARAEASRNEPVRQAPPERARGTDDQGRVRAPRSTGGGERAANPPRERAQPREAAPPPVVSDPRQAAASGNAASSSEEGQRRAVPRGSRPRADNPTVGRAVPRDGQIAPPRWTGVYPRYRYYTYPRRLYPYGYGAFGLGYFYYDPYTWYAHDPYWNRRYYYDPYSRPYPDAYYDTGELRLRVKPRHAEVYVDDYFAGYVDDFDGTFQALRLEEGPHKIEIVAPGYETLRFDVRIDVRRKITYRGDLLARP